MQKKYFTLEEAQKEISLINEKLKILINNKKALDLLNSVQIEFTEEYNGEFEEIDFTKTSKEFHKLSYEFFSIIDEFEERGIIIKDLDEGLIDFLALFEDREIFLCWKYGEDKIKYWHETEEGFNGRKPIHVLKINPQKL